MKYILWNEASLRDRKMRDRATQVSQMERLAVFLPEDQTFAFHNRTYFPGTNRGDTIYAVKAPKWDDSWLIHFPKILLFRDLDLE